MRNQFCRFSQIRNRLSSAHTGYQVAPAELEELLLQSPDVNDAAVIGIPGSVSIACFYPIHALIFALKQGRHRTSESVRRARTPRCHWASHSRICHRSGREIQAPNWRSRLSGRDPEEHKWEDLTKRLERSCKSGVPEWKRESKIMMVVIYSSVVDGYLISINIFIFQGNIEWLLLRVHHKQGVRHDHNM